LIPKCRGASVARKFALKYPVALLARNPANYEPLVKEIEAAGGKAIGISTDVADGASVANAFEKIKAEMKGAQLAAAVFNVGGKFIRKPFLELNEEDFMAGMEANGYEQSSCSSRVSLVKSDADMAYLQQGCLPFRPSLPPTSPERDLRRVSTHTHFYISHSSNEGLGAVLLVRHWKVCYESIGPIAGTRIWTKRSACGPRDYRRSH
jgi:hypothetical protein